MKLITYGDIITVRGKNDLWAELSFQLCKHIGSDLSDRLWYRVWDRIRNLRWTWGEWEVFT